MTEVFLRSNVFLLAAATVYAADTGIVRGELICETCPSYQNLKVDLEDNSHRPITSCPVDSRGGFEVVGVPEGNYLARVKNITGDILVTEHISVSRTQLPLTIRIVQHATVVRSGTQAESSTVSIRRLTHKIPKQARKEFEKALASGADHTKAIEHLRKAIEIDPEYLEALNNLGARYLGLGKPAEAMTVLGRAMDLDSSSSLVLTNIVLATIGLGKYAEAEQAARRATRLSGSDTRARYLLGLTLYLQRKFTSETVTLLSASDSVFPNAKIALAQIHASRGENMEARQYLREYLDTGQTHRREQVVNMLAILPNPAAQVAERNR